MSIGRIILIRHAESEKNIEDRHGGSGRPLTAKGQLQLERLVAFLHERVKAKPAAVYSSPIAQAKYTAECIADSFNVPCKSDIRLRPLNLGVLSGLSRLEAEKTYPEAAARLEQWRIGLLRIENLDIPEAEHFDEFWSRGYSFLTEIIPIYISANDLCIVGTRSILILLSNVLLRNTLLAGRPYSVMTFDNCSVSICEHIKELDAKIVVQNATEFLME